MEKRRVGRPPLRSLKICFSDISTSKDNRLAKAELSRLSARTKLMPLRYKQEIPLITNVKSSDDTYMHGECNYIHRNCLHKLYDISKYKL
jgi:hypothetical protein